MPHSAPSRCTEPGCGELATNRGRCGDHQRKGWSGSSRSTIDRLGITSSAWERLRRQILRRDDDTCQSCGGVATEVDHIVPVSEGGAKTDPGNLQSLCSPCHDAKTKAETARQNRRLARARRAAAARAAEPPPF